jgi:mono/diheme cytochrome c family protein
MQIILFPELQPMPPLTVVEAAAAPAAAPSAALALPAGFSVGMLAGIAAFTAGGAAALLLFTRRLRPALASGVVAALALAAFAASPAPPSVAQKAAPDQGYLAGQTLFIAKGCVVCHTHAAMDEQYAAISTRFGKDLTNYNLGPEYLRHWLTSPSSIKPATEMPNLHLTQAEIDDLINFLAPQD